ncbi:MAG: hypothetical protein JWQ79_2878 [Mucilaginibacter sp.]|nr:hypothetical protein [Mucilaginibacter sp.]
MYFIFSKILLFLILPIYWVAALLLIALISKDRKRKRHFFIAAALVFYFFSNGLLLNLFAKQWDFQPVALNSSQHYSCAIVLGGFSGSDVDEKGYFNTSADRFIQGLKLLNSKKVSRLLISSGNGNLIAGTFREAAWVKTQLLEMGVPDSVILIENNSKNTFENARFSKTVLQQSHLPPPYLLVTSAFHMRRAQMIFKNAGIPVIPYPCNYLAGRGNISILDLLPDTNALNLWNYYIKEVIGYIINYFK